MASEVEAADIASQFPDLRENYPYSSLDFVIQDAVNEAYDTAAFEFANSVINGVAEAAAGLAGMVAAFAEALDQITAGSKAQLADAHYELARKAADVTAEVYGEKRASGRMAGPYRLTSRDAGGRMEAAIRNPSFVRGTYDGIGFANTVLLDRQARQWHRLNFGAGGAAGSSPTRYAVHWSTAVIASIGLDDSPSAAFALPAGFWVKPGPGARVKAGEGRTDWFYPTSERGALAGLNIRGRPGKARPTKGIRAWEFLDAGIQTIAEGLPVIYENLYRRWYESALRGVGPLSRVVNAKVTSPRPVSGGIL